MAASDAEAPPSRKLGNLALIWRFAKRCPGRIAGAGLALLTASAATLAIPDGFRRVIDGILAPPWPTPILSVKLPPPSRFDRWLLATYTPSMTSIDLKLRLPDRLAKEAEAEGLLAPRALAKLVREELRRTAAARLIEGAARASEAGSRPMSMAAIQREVDSVRAERRSPKRG